MKRKSFLFAVVLIIAVSWVPLSGASAQRSASAPAAPSMSTVPAPAARTIHSKEIKTQLIVICSGSPGFRYVQKLYWMYNYKYVRYWQAVHKGLVYRDRYVRYDGHARAGVSGGIGYPYYYRWTVGYFWWKAGEVYILTNIEQEVYADGTYWTNKWWHFS